MTAASAGCSFYHEALLVRAPGENSSMGFGFCFKMSIHAMEQYEIRKCVKTWNSRLSIDHDPWSCACASCSGSASIGRGSFEDCLSCTVNGEEIGETKKIKDLLSRASPRAHLRPRLQTYGGTELLTSLRIISTGGRRDSLFCSQSNARGKGCSPLTQSGADADAAQMTMTLSGDAASTVACPASKRAGPDFLKHRGLQGCGRRHHGVQHEPHSRASLNLGCGNPPGINNKRKSQEPLHD